MTLLLTVASVVALAAPAPPDWTDSAVADTFWMLLLLTWTFALPSGLHAMPPSSAVAAAPVIVLFEIVVLLTELGAAAVAPMSIASPLLLVNVLPTPAPPIVLFIVEVPLLMSWRPSSTPALVNVELWTVRFSVPLVPVSCALKSKFELK